MNEELDRKRQEKVASFKLHIEDDAEEEEIVSSSQSVSGSVQPEESTQDTGSPETENDPENNSAEESEISYNDSTAPSVNAQLSDEEINSYSDEYEAEMPVQDKMELEKAKKHEKKIARLRAKRNRVTFRVVWLVMIMFVSILFAEYLIVGINDFLAVGREEEKSVSITIPKDATIDDITDILYDNNIIKNKLFFKLYAVVTKSTNGFTNGTFDVMANKDYMALINYMQSDMNRTDVVTIRFTEGMSIMEYAKLLEENKVCAASDFLDMCNSDQFDDGYEFIKNITNKSKRYYKLEGYLFPDTYDFYVGEDIDSVIMKFLANYRRKLFLTKSRAKGFDKKVTIEERAKAAGMTMEEVINLASMIQAEAANEDDMYVISSILHNRLDTLKNDGINDNGEGGLGFLQLDSTVYYPYASENDVPAAQRKTYVSNYSTYKYEGLPAGPICNPGLAAIEAAVSPPKTNYYYFCHKAATGDSPAVPYYAETMRQHLINQEEAGLI